MSDPKLGPSAAQITMMGHNISSRITALRARRRRRARLLAAAGGLVVVGALTAAVIAVRPVPEEIHGVYITCFHADDPGSTFSSSSALEDADLSTVAGRIDAALTVCDLLYGQAGVFAPAPTVCELRDLRVAVFPNQALIDDPEKFCTSLGLGLPS